MKSAACPDAIARITGYSGLIDRVSGMDFYVPGFQAGVDTTRVADPAHPKFGELINAGNVFHAVTPSTRKNTLYFFAMSGMNEE